MKKILIISASPRVNSNSEALAKAFPGRAGENPAHPSPEQAYRMGKGV